MQRKGAAPLALARFDSWVVQATKVKRVPRSAAARRVLALSAPTQPPAGALEAVAGHLLARAAPFDQPVHALLLSGWGLQSPTASPFVGYLDPPAATAGARLLGVHRQLRRLTSSCAAPAALLSALRLSASQPALTTRELGAALATAGLSEGQAGAPLLVALAHLWDLPLPDSLDPPQHVRDHITAIAADVRTAGVLRSTSLPAGQTAFLRDAGVHDAGGWLVASDDRLSLLARPIRRQLAAAGPLTVDELTVGARRQRSAMTGLDRNALLAWARTQSDLHVEGHRVALVHSPHRWLQPSDPRVLALFTDQASTVARGDILTALVAGGMSPGSAEVWTVRCSWLRPSGRRGQYILAGRQDAAAIFAASA